MPMLLMMEDRQKIQHSYEELQKEKKQLKEEYHSKLDCYKLFLNRFKKSQAIVQKEKERLSVGSHSREFDPYFLMKVGELGVNNLVGLPLPDNMPKLERDKRGGSGVLRSSAEQVQRIMTNRDGVMFEGEMFLGEVEKRRGEMRKREEIIGGDITMGLEGGGYVC